jgi:hypothetical protein
MWPSTHVTDVRSNPNDQIAHAASVLLRSEHRKRVFRAIYKGKQKIKKVSDLTSPTRLSRVRVLQEGKILANNGIVRQLKIEGETAYEKDNFYSQHRHRILSIARDKKRLERFPTKVRPHISATKVEVVQLPRRFIRVRRITIEDVDSFAKVRRLGEGLSQMAHPLKETLFKRGIQKVLGEVGKFQDWGGELNDLLTTRLRVGGRRVTAAFGLKGPGQGGILTPKKMGKNGDQVQRLFVTQADVFLIQYWSQVHESIYNLMHELAKAKSASEGREILYGVIDGKDTQALVLAYPRAFSARR